MEKKIYRTHTSEFKLKVLQQHLLDKVAVSDICEEHKLKPSVFYSWQKDLFDHGEVVFNIKNNKHPHADCQKKIKYLEEKITQKNEVLAELMQEHIKLKKEFGDI